MEINIIVDKRQEYKGVKRSDENRLLCYTIEVKRLIVFFFVLHLNCLVWQRVFKRATCYVLSG